MNKIYKKNLYKNATITLVSQIIRMILQFVLQRVFINSLGITYLGYNSVFKNILQMLNMADLGVGVAITSFLYKPLADNNAEEVKALMYLYKKIYNMLGLVVIGIGAIIAIVLPIIIPDASCSYTYLRVLFCINVISTISTYFLAYRRTLLVANQMSYFTSTVDLKTELGLTIVQILFLLFAPNYLIYLILNVVKSILGNIIISVHCGRKYEYFFSEADENVVKEYKKSVLVYVKDIFVSKIGAYIYNGTDNLIISIFKGSLLTGYLSNYSLVSIGLKSIVTQMLSSVQATYGNYVVRENDQKKKCRMTDNYFYLDYLIGSVCAICCILLYQPFISIYFGSEYLLNISTVVLISVNLGLSILLIIPSQIFIVFKLYKYDKKIICISAVINIVVSVILVMVIGLNGVLIGTTITSLIYLLSRFYIIAKELFEISYWHYIKKLFIYIIVSSITLLILFLLHKILVIDGWIDLVIVAIFDVIISFSLQWLLTIFMEERRFVKQEILPIKGKMYKISFFLVIFLGFLLYAFMLLVANKK